MSKTVLIERPDVGLVASRVSLRTRLAARLGTTSLDEALAVGAGPESGPALALRAERLISHRMRSRLARSLRSYVDMARRPPTRVPWPAAAPPLPAGEPHVAGAVNDLLALADLLEEPGPADVRGVALVRVLLTDGRSPLHCNRGAGALAAAARAAGEALDPRTPAAA